MLWNILAVMLIACAHCDEINTVFPLQEFLEYHNITYDPEELLPNLCTTSSAYRTCSCDKERCIGQTNCCFDYLWEAEKPVAMETYTSRLLSPPLHQKMACHDLIFDFSLMMTDRCRQKGNTWLVEKCEGHGTEKVNTLPVMGVDDMLYRNMYCARCNDIQSFTDVEIDITCVQIFNRTLQDFLQNQFFQCDLSFNEDNSKGYNRICVTSKCNKVTANLCHYFLSNFTILSQDEDHYETFKNVFCKKCGILKIRVAGRSWSKTLTLNYFQNIKASCPADMVFNTQLASCVPYTCGPGFTLIENRCKKNTVISVKDSQKCPKSCPFRWYLIFKKDFPESDKVQLLDLLQTYSLIYSNSSMSAYEVPFNETLISIVMSSISHHSSSLKLVVTTGRIHISKIHGFQLHQYSIQGLCTEPMKFLDQQFIIKPNCLCQELNTRRLSLKDPLNSAVEIVYEKMDLVASSYYCRGKSYHLQGQCLRIELNHSSFEQNSGSLTISMVKTGQILQPREYLPTANGVQICIKEEHEFSWTKNVAEAQFVISISGTTISLVSYIASIRCYLQLPKKRFNTGTFNITALIFLLLKSDLIFLASILVNLNTPACKWFSIALHWSLINIAVWNVYMCLTITRAFTTLTIERLSQRGIRRRAINSFVTCIVSTSLLIIILIVINETNVYDFIYGVKACWIGDSSARILAYYIPATISYLSCVFTLVVIARIIHQSRNRTRQVLRNIKNQVKIRTICIRLALILGITEGFGLIQSPLGKTTDETILKLYAGLSLIYNIARSLRGLAVSILEIKRPKYGITLTNTSLSSTKSK